MGEPQGRFGRIPEVAWHATGGAILPERAGGTGDADRARQYV